MITDIEKVNNIIWKSLVYGIHSLGEIILSPERFDRNTKTSKLGYADSTIILIYNLEVENVRIDPVLSDGRELLNFFYNAINTNSYDDAKTLINSTSLWRIVRHTRSSAKVKVFPNDAIPILRDFLIEVSKTIIDIKTFKTPKELIGQIT
jgi:hypothetical protein